MSTTYIVTYNYNQNQQNETVTKEFSNYAVMFKHVVEIIQKQVLNITVFRHCFCGGKINIECIGEGSPAYNTFRWNPTHKGCK